MLIGLSLYLTILNTIAPLTVKKHSEDVPH